MLTNLNWGHRIVLNKPTIEAIRDFPWGWPRATTTRVHIHGRGHLAASRINMKWPQWGGDPVIEVTVRAVSTVQIIIHCIARKFGRDFNLVVWRSAFKLKSLHRIYSTYLF